MSTYTVIFISFLIPTTTAKVQNEPIILVKEIKNDSNRLIYDLPKCAIVENGTVKFKAKFAELENFCPSTKNTKSTKCLTQNPSENSECEQEATPYIRLLKQSCTNNENRKLFGFGYLFCPAGATNEEFQKYVYKFCFDGLHQETVYVDYKISSPRLLSDMEFEKNQEYVSEIQYDEYNIEFFRFQRLEAVRRIRKQKNATLRERMLIPPTHIAIRPWKKPLFHGVNTELINEDMVTYIEYVDNYLSHHIATKIGEIRIKAGAFHRTDTRITHIWWKLVYDTTEQYAMAIIIHHGEELPEETKCIESICNEYGWYGLELNSTNSSKIIYCCMPDVITKNFKFNDVKVFNITDLAINTESHDDDACG